MNGENGGVAAPSNRKVYKGKIHSNTPSAPLSERGRLQNMLTPVAKVVNMDLLFDKVITYQEA
jgi:hypothetical protein